MDCFRSEDLIGIGMEADAVRRRLHPNAVVSYAIDSSLRNAYPAICNEKPLGAEFDRLCEEIQQTVEMGGTGVRLVSGTGGRDGLWLAGGMEGFERVLGGIRQRFPSLWIEGLAATQIVMLAAVSGLELSETIKRLRDAGMDSITDDTIAGDAGQTRCNLQQWLAVHRVAHGLGMQTVATMFSAAGENGAGAAGAAAIETGATETMQRQVDFLVAVRRLQEETGGFAAFVPQGFPLRNATTGGWEQPTAAEQLKTLAVARVFLDNIRNIQLRGVIQGLKVLQTGLLFGANDAGSVTPEARVTSRATEEDLRHVIRDAGFLPVRRDTSYRMMFLN